MAGEIILILIVAVFLLVRVRAVMRAFNARSSTPPPHFAVRPQRPVAPPLAPAARATPPQPHPIQPQLGPVTANKTAQRAQAPITRGPTPEERRAHEITAAKALPLWDGVFYLYERWRMQSGLVWPKEPDYREVFPDASEAELKEAGRAAWALLNDPNLGTNVYGGPLSHTELIALLERTHKGFSRRTLEHAISHWMFIYR